MRLADLSPRMAGNVLRFRCPHGMAHTHAVPLGAPIPDRVWASSGTFPDTLTVTPSIDAAKLSPKTGRPLCTWHGFITNGEVT